MKYDFLVKEKIKNTFDDPFEESTCVNETNNDHIKKNDDYSYIGSTYDDFNIFLKKTQEQNKKNIDIKHCEKKDEKKDDKHCGKNEDEKKDDKHCGKNEDNDSGKNKVTHSGKNDNSTLFESEKKTVETIVKYSSSFINLLLNFVLILKNTLWNLISKKKINTESIKDKEIIDKFNKNIKQNNKHNEKRGDKHNEKRRDKHNEKKGDKHIKKINSYLLELD